MKQIFIIDDNKLLLSYIENRLRKSGHEVTTTPSSLQALNMLVEHTPDVVFIDYFLPSLNGDKLCQIIRKMAHLKSAYLVIMSAAASELELELSSMGADAIIAKGSFKETVQYMLSAIEDSESTSSDMPVSEAMGFDSVHPRQITNELLGKYRHLQTMLDSISEGIVEINAGRIVYANPTALSLLDKREDQLLGTYLPDLFDGPVLTQVDALIRADTGGPSTTENQRSIRFRERILFIKKLPFQDDEDTIIILITDVTERMHLEAERTRAENILRESEEMARALLNATTEAVALIDPGGVVFDVNEEYAHRYDKTKAELINTIIWDLLPTELARHRREKADQVLETAKAVRFEDDYEGTWNDNVIYPVLDINGNVMRLALFSRDITAHRKIQEQLVRSERLVATGQLAVSIAHEINSPLQAVNAILGTLKKEYSDSEALLDSLDLLRVAFISIRDTVRNLLDLNRPGKEEKQLANINDIIERTADLVRSHLKKNRVSIQLDLSPDTPSMMASPQQLNHMVLNLITNAVEAMTNVSKRAGWKERTSIGGEIHIQANPRGNDIVIRVTDTGPGIPEEDLEHIFDPFYTRKKTMGMGVGLTICHGIVEDHGGTIAAGNSPDGGAVFTITLPLT